MHGDFCNGIHSCTLAYIRAHTKRHDESADGNGAITRDVKKVQRSIAAPFQCYAVTLGFAVLLEIYAKVCAGVKQIHAIGYTVPAS